jgi:hypothetical protein
MEFGEIQPAFLSLQTEQGFLQLCAGNDTIGVESKEAAKEVTHSICSQPLTTWSCLPRDILAGTQIFSNVFAALPLSDLPDLLLDVTNANGRVWP